MMTKYQQAKEILYKITHDDHMNDCEQLFCKLHDDNYLGLPENNTTNSHNCIACNLQDGNLKIYKFLNELGTVESTDELEYASTIYYLLLYLQVEKFHTIFKFIGITFEYVEQNWETLIQIRKWANFIKHPKGFLFTHHPTFIYDDNSTITSLKANKQNQIIDYEIIKKFYTRETDDAFKNTIKEVGNKKNIIVILPCPVRIMIEYSKINQEFCKKIGENPHFKEILKKHSTIEDY
jgi:hypothetical protein